MGGVRDGKDPNSPEKPETRQRASAGPPRLRTIEAPDFVEGHRRQAARLLREGHAARAFGELVRASRSVPMTVRLASVLVAFSLRAGTEAAAIALLTSSLGHTRGNTRRAVRLQLVRVLRRVDQKPRALEMLQALIEESPGDRHAIRLQELLSGRETPRSRTQRPPGLVPLPTRSESPSAPPRPWEEESTAGSSTPLDARFSPRASSEEEEYTVEAVTPPEPRPPPPEEKRTVESPAPPPRRFSPSDESYTSELVAPLPEQFEPSVPHTVDRHGTVLDMPSPWSQEEITSETAGTPPSAPRDERLEVTDFPVNEPVPPAPVRSGPPVPWGGDDGTGPSLSRTPRRENPDDTRVEAQLIARRAWRELAGFYLAWAERAGDLTVRAEVLTRLAELLEDELNDEAEAARVYGQIVALTGDKAALAEQVRLLSQRNQGDDWAVRRVLDEAVQRATTPGARAAAFLARGERLLATGERALALADFEATVALEPHSLPALMGCARCVAASERAVAAERLRAELATMPRRALSRAEGLRLLGELVSGESGDARLAHWAWSEVLAESPEDGHAQEQLLALARRLGDPAGLSRLLRAGLAREPRGPAARKARLELVALLEAAGDREASLAELRQAVRFEPGHKDAWLLLVDRLIELGQKGEAAWALEHAATATEDDQERLGTWERLARFCREVLGDAAKAQVYATRADNMREALAEQARPPEPPRSAVPTRESSGSRTVVLIPPPSSLIAPSAMPPAAPESLPTVLEMPAVEPPPPSPRPVTPAPLVGESVAVKPPPAAKPPATAKPPPTALEPHAEQPSVESTRVLSWEAPPGKMDNARRRFRPGAESGPAVPPPEPPAPVTPPAPAAPPASTARASPEARPGVVERVRERPLDPDAYRDLSAFFLSRGDQSRGALMAEVASALAGAREGANRPPRRALTAEERAGLRHPGLRNPAGEMLALVGFALCRLFPTYGRAAGSAEPLRPDSGPGARVALDALQSVARLLDMPLPEVCLSEDDGPPFSLVYPGSLRVLVGKHAVRQALSESELRFFAGRALFCVGPDLLALRCLRKDQLLRAVALLSSVLRGGSEFGPEARVVLDALHPKARERALGLLEPAQRGFDAVALAEAARHSANRAGLVACGGPGPAVAALRALKSSEQECVELVRFSASERYLPLRALGS